MVLRSRIEYPTPLRRNKEICPAPDFTTSTPGHALTIIEPITKRRRQEATIIHSGLIRWSPQHADGPHLHLLLRLVRGQCHLSPSTYCEVKPKTPTPSAGRAYPGSNRATGEGRGSGTPLPVWWYATTCLRNSHSNHDYIEANCVNIFT